MPHAFHLPVQIGQLLDEHALTVQELAQACGRVPEWVLARLEAGVIEAHSASAGAHYFTSTTLVRARRIAQLEATFDADPYLAALTTDLIEEVALLRQRLAQWEPQAQPPPQQP